MSTIGSGGFFIPAVYCQNQKNIDLALNRGEIDYAELTQWTFPDEFLCFTQRYGLLDFVDATYPNPRKKNEIPIWYLITCQFLLRIFGQVNYRQLKYLLNSGSMLTRFGFNVGTSVVGFNRKNKKSRKTFVDQDAIRKFFKDTDPKQIRQWYNTELQGWFRKQKVSDARGIFVLDQTHLVVPNNPHYQGAAKMPVDEHGQLYKNLAKLSAEQKKALVCHSCYALSTLLQVGIDKQFFHVSAYEFGPGNEDELVQAKKIVSQFCARHPGTIKELIVDRGYIDGGFIEKLKVDYQIDSLLPLKTNMATYQDAVSIASTENQWNTIELLRNDDNKLIKKMEVAAVPEIELWDRCKIKLYTVVARVTAWDQTKEDYDEHFWVLGSTKAYKDPGIAVARYRLRVQTEERFRQFKYDWRISKFPSPNSALMESHVCFTLFTYSLLQLYLRRNDLREQTSRMIQTMRREETTGQKAVVAYADHEYGIFDLDDYTATVAGLEDQPRQKLKATMKHQKEVRLKQR